LAHFFKNLSAPNSYYCQQRAATPNAAKTVLKSAPNSHHYYCSGILYPTACMGSTALSRAEKPSEEITRRLFLMNIKGLRGYLIISPLVSYAKQYFRNYFNISPLVSYAK
jgi:hypothetical protein